MTATRNGVSFVLIISPRKGLARIGNPLVAVESSSPIRDPRQAQAACDPRSQCTYSPVRRRASRTPQVHCRYMSKPPNSLTAYLLMLLFLLGGGAASAQYGGKSVVVTERTRAELLAYAPEG